MPGRIRDVRGIPSTVVPPASLEKNKTHFLIKSNHMEYIAITFKMLLHVERFQENKIKYMY